ncbi:MAG TPA: hypothetical protein VK155_09860 [Bacteroidales bacterium]|nr:hypothetical protein [Bacteroidales bacterium]
MKRTILIIACIIACGPGNLLLCQQFENIQQPVPEQHFFIGIGLGVNEYGLGFILETPSLNDFSINLDAGIGGWGWKLGGSMNHYFSNNKHHELSIGYSHASGLKDFETDLSVEPSGNSQSVNLDLMGVSTVNVIYTYNLKVGRTSKIAFSAGYAICLTQDGYKLHSPVTLDRSSDLLLDIMQPGGIIVGIKLMIGGL